MADHVTTAHCGDGEAALQSAVTSLTHHGFRIAQQNKGAVTLDGPGINSTRQNPLLGASRIKLTASMGSLRAESELGGVRKMQRFVLWFPLLLGLTLGTIFTIGGGFGFGAKFGVGFGIPWAPGAKWVAVALGAGLLPVLPWLIIGPLMGRMMIKRTTEALDTLVHNATALQKRT